MTPAAILARAEALGLTLIPDGQQIRVRGPSEAIAEVTPLITANKPEILRALTDLEADYLENLIRRAGTYWEYSPEDYALVRDLARRDPEGLRLALESDRWMNAIERVTP